MKKYSCLIADDESLARDLLETHLSKIPLVEIVAVCTDAINAKLYLQQNNVDIMLLDINMPGLSGIELLRILKHKPATIITTAHPAHSLESYELDVIDYILKPIEFERLFKAVAKAMDWVNYSKEITAKTQSVPVAQKEKTYFFIKVNYKIIKVDFDDILFIEALEKYVRINTSEERHVTLMSIGQLEKILPEAYFVRIHRSFIVNLNRIDSIEGNMVNIGKHQLTISKGQKEDLLKKINL